MEVKKILCAVDLEDTIAPSVEYAKMMASMTGASILVAYVIPAHTPYEDVYLSVNNQPNEVNNPNETIQKSMNALLAEQFAGMDATALARQVVSAFTVVLHLERGTDGRRRIAHAGRFVLRGDRLAMEEVQPW